MVVEKGHEEEVFDVVTTFYEGYGAIEGFEVLLAPADSVGEDDKEGFGREEFDGFFVVVESKEGEAFGDFFVVGADVDGDGAGVG